MPRRLARSRLPLTSSLWSRTPRASLAPGVLCARCCAPSSWNFEKFLVNQKGVPVRRYSPKFATIDIAADIEALIKGGPDALA